MEIYKFVGQIKKTKVVVDCIHQFQNFLTIPFYRNLISKFEKTVTSNLLKLRDQVNKIIMIIYR